MNKNLISTALLLTACASSPERENTRDADADVSPVVRPPSEDGCTLKVSDGWIDHACLHANMGPFRERDASPVGSNSDVDVSRAHTAFTLKLTPTEKGFSGEVRYLPRARGGHAIFVSNDASVTVTADGSPAALAHFTTHRTELCPELPWVQALTMDVVPHTLRIESDQSSVMVVLEYLDEGKPEDSYTQACTPDGGSVSPIDAELDAGARDASTPVTLPDAQLEGDAQLGADTSTAMSDATAPDAELVPDAGDGAAECWIDPVLEHSCLHVNNGPYGDVAAAASAANAPNVNMPHTTYRIQLPGGEGGWLTYRPNQEGEYVFYASVGTTLELQSANGSLPLLFDEPVAGCTGVARAFVFGLVAGQRYTLRVTQATAGAQALIVIENVPALAPNGWAARLEKCE